MQQKDLRIINKLGLHARAAAKFVTLASQFACDVQVARGTQEVNGKSIMGIMMLAASQGTIITLTTDGPDEVEAMERLEQLVNDRFEEAE